MKNKMISKASKKANDLNNHDAFLDRITRGHAVTTIELKPGMDTDNIDVGASINKAENTIAAFSPQDATQLMLITQMAAVHDLQQKMISFATASVLADHVVTYVNCISKLSNLFVQQANTLNKLKGTNEQKVVFEHVHVHSGGQAVVGTVHTHPRDNSKERKK